MHILVLDDDETRLTIFKRNLIGHVVDCVKTAENAIEKLSGEEYNALFLDHDLGGRVLVPSGPGTGYEVAQWLAEHADRQPEMIFIHSFNPVGSNNMKGLLPRAIKAPGVWLKLDRLFSKQ